MNQHNILEWIREYASNRINSRLIDERRCIPPYIVLDFGNKGLLGMSVQKKYGGLELNNYESVKVVEQLGSIDFSLASFVGLNNALGIRPIMKFANQSIKEELLPKLAIGRELAAFALTETDAGSNPLAIKSNAVQESVDSWRLYGKKIWSGSAAWASVINVFVKSDKGITAFALRQQKGVRQGEESLTMGLRGMVQNSIYLEGAIVSKEDQLGEEGYGMAVAQDAMMYGRLGIAAAALGSMKKCAQLMLRYASRRTISTGFLLDNPVTLTKLTEATSAINVLDTLVEEIAKFIDSNIEVPVEYYVTCKILGSEHFYKAADDLIQVMGGRGYMEPNIAPQLLRDARIARIFEGPTETLYSFLGASVLNNPQKLYQFIDTQLINQSMVTRIKTVIMQIESCIDSKSIAPTKNHWINYIIGNIICYYLSLSVLEY